MGFPIVKLVILSGKLVAKMISKHAKRQFVRSDQMVTTCYSTVNKYNKLEAQIRTKMTGKLVDARYMSRDETMSFFTELLGELVVFGSVAGFITVEYVRSESIEQGELKKIYHRLEKLEGVK